MARSLRLHDRRRIRPFFATLAAAWLLIALTVDTASARDLGSRLGSGPAGPEADAVHQQSVVSVAEAVWLEQFVLPLAGPIAVDGAGRLLLLAPTRDGYGVVGLTDTEGGGFELLYRRKGTYGTSLAVGPGGRFCVGSMTGVDCVDGLGQIAHYEHALLTNIVAVALDGPERLWVLRAGAGGTTNLQLVAVAPDGDSVDAVAVLNFRQSVQGFAGNGMAARPGGGLFMPVVENDIHRVLYVDPQGNLNRTQDFWRLGGGIAVDGDGTFYVDGVKRPQSVQEQREPIDVVLAAVSRASISEGMPAAGAAGIVAHFPTAPAGLGSRLTGYVALGGDGTLYVIREQPVRVDDRPAQHMPVLWAASIGRAGAIGAGARVIDFRIPFIEDMANARFSLSEDFSPLDYAGPLLVARGQMLLITGVNFTGKAGVQRVFIGGKEALVDAWSSDFIAVTLPADVAAGKAAVRVAIDDIVSDPEHIEVKTAEVPGWFQIGSPGMRAALDGNAGISGYSANITIAGVTQAGEFVSRAETMATPGLFHARLPNGVYEASFTATYLVSDVRFGPNNQYVGSTFAPVTVPEQTFTFEITDIDPVVLWTPMMLGQ